MKKKTVNSSHFDNWWMMQFVARIIHKRSRDSSVSVVAEQQGFRFSQRVDFFLFATTSRPSLGLSQRDIERVQRVCLKV